MAKLTSTLMVFPWAGGLVTSVVELAQINQSSAPLAFRRAGDSFGAELAMCQRFYEKSFQLDVTPATLVGTSTAYFTATYTSTTALAGRLDTYKVLKRAVPINVIYDTTTANAPNRITSLNPSGGNNSLPCTPVGDISNLTLTITGAVTSSIGVGSLCQCNWTADAEI